MIKDIKNTIFESAVYGLSRISNKLIAFILLPVITSYLSVNDYGVYVRIESLWQIFWVIFLFGIESAIIRWFTLIEDSIKRKKFLFTVTFFIFLFNILSFFIIFYFSRLLSDVIFDTSIFSNLIIFAALIAVSEAFAFIFFLILRIERRALLYTLLSILNSVILLVLQYYFLLIYENKLEGIFTAKIFAPLIIVILLSPYYLKYLKPGFEKLLLKEVIFYSLPVMAGGLAITLVNQVDKFILGKFGSSGDAGLYGLATYIAGLISMLVISPFSLSFSVSSWQKLKDENAKRFYTKNITYLFFACLYFALFISLFTPHFIKIFTARTDYWLAWKYVPWIAIATAFYGIHFISVFSFYVTKKTKYIFYSYLAALLTSILFNVILIPLIGISGSVIASISSFMILVTMLYFLSKKEYFFDYEWLKLGKLITVYSAVNIIFLYISVDTVYLFILKFIGLIMFPIILFLIGFYEKIELVRIAEFFKKYIFRSSK